MKRVEVEKEIIEKLKEIREILHEYDPGSTYLAAVIDGSKINCYNDEFKAAVKPIDCCEDDSGFRSFWKRGREEDNDAENEAG